MKYPYIGKGTESGSIVLFYEQNKGVTLESKTWASENLEHSNCVNEDLFTNITREYLANTYGKVESKEHAEFIVKLAENAGVCLYNNYGYDEGDDCFVFNSSGLYFWPKNNSKDKKLITIPIPPKESKLPVASSGAKMPKVKEPKKVSVHDIQVNVTNNTDSLIQIKKSEDESSIFIYVNDPPKEPNLIDSLPEAEPTNAFAKEAVEVVEGGICEAIKSSSAIHKLESQGYKFTNLEWVSPNAKKEPEPKEWPQVGDKFIHKGELVKCISKGKMSNGDEVITFEFPDGLSHGSCWNNDSWVQKPPTPEEELTSAFDEYESSDSYGYSWENLARAIINGEIKGLSYKPE